MPNIIFVYLEFFYHTFFCLAIYDRLVWSFWIPEYCVDDYNSVVRILLLCAFLCVCEEQWWWYQRYKKKLFVNVSKLYFQCHHHSGYRLAFSKPFLWSFPYLVVSLKIFKPSRTVFYLESKWLKLTLLVRFHSYYFNIIPKLGSEYLCQEFYNFFSSSKKYSQICILSCLVKDC